MHRITLEIELSDAEDLMVRQNSIERVINTSIRCSEACEAKGRGEISELGSTNWQDWEELKPFTVRVWDEIRNELMKAKYHAK